MKVIQVSLDIIMTDNHTIEDIENELKNICGQYGYMVVDSNSTDISDYYNQFDASDFELQIYLENEE